MKNFAKILIVLLICLCIVAMCFIWYNTATQKNGVNEENSSSEVPSNIESKDPDEEEISTEALFTLENYPRVDASLAIHPLVNSIASNFLNIREDELNFEYTKTRTSDVYKNLVDGNADVIFVAEPSSGDLEYAKSKGVELKIIPVTSSAFVFIVNSQNPVDNLTKDEIIKIYKGDITNWKEVGGDDEEIIPYQRPNGSGSQTAMISLVMKDANLMSAPKMQVEGEMGGLIDAIAEYDNSKAAIGYSYFYYVNTMYKKDTIKMLGIDGIKPNIATIKDGTYPIYTNGYIAIRVDEPEDSSALKWLNAVLSSRGNKIIEDAGYVPIN